MTYEQAFYIFLYADWTMWSAAFAALCAAIVFVVVAILPMNKGRRKRYFKRSLISVSVVALYMATNMAMFYAMSDMHSVSVPKLLSEFPVNLVFSLPILLMVAGFVASVVYAVRSMLRRTGADRRRSLLKAVLGAVIFCLGAVPYAAATLIPFLVVEDHSKKEGTLVRSGDPVPDFELATVDGSPFNTVELRGRVIVVNFFATWCGPCNLELPQLQALWDEFRDDGDFRMLVVGREETDEVLKTFREKHGLSIPMASDLRGAVYGKYAAKYIPRTFLVSRQGTIIYEWTGNWEAEISKLRKLLRSELAKK